MNTSTKSIEELPVLVLYSETVQSNGKPKQVYHLARLTSKAYDEVQFADNETLLKTAQHVEKEDGLEQLADAYFRGSNNKMGIITTINGGTLGVDASNSKERVSDTYDPVSLDDMKLFKERYMLGPLA